MTESITIHVSFFVAVVASVASDVVVAVVSVVVVAVAFSATKTCKHVSK